MTPPACSHDALQIVWALEVYSNIMKRNASGCRQAQDVRWQLFGCLPFVLCVQGLNSGLQLLQRAYAADAHHPGVLVCLSHFSLLKGQAEQVGLPLNLLHSP